MTNKLVESGITRKSKREETSLDVYVYNEMLKLGYDIYAFDSSSKSAKYNDCADKAIECLINGKPIPEDIKNVLLSEKHKKEEFSDNKNSGGSSNE